MRKNLFLAMASCLIFNFISAQIQIGFTAGGNYSEITIKEERKVVRGSAVVLTDKLATEGKTRYKIGYHGGILLYSKLSSKLSAKSGIIYRTQGWEESITVTKTKTSTICCPPTPSVNYIETFRISYFNVPAILNFTTPVQKKILVFGLGPYISLPVNGKVTSKIISFQKDTNLMPGEVDTISKIAQQIQNSAVSFVSFNKKTDTCNCYLGNSIDYGVSLNVGLMLRSGLAFDVSYQLGLKDVLTNRYFIFPNRNRVLSLSLTYFLFNKLNNLN